MSEDRVEVGAEVQALLAALGYDGRLDLVRSITVYPREVLLEVYKTDELSGAKFRRDGEAASETQRILIGVATGDGSGHTLPPVSNETREDF